MGTLFQDLADRLQGWRFAHDQWMPYWQQLTDVLLPNKADFTKKQTVGQSREVGIYDGTPRLAARDLSSTLDGLIKPKTSNWFTPGVDDEAIAKQDDVKLWFEIVRDRMWRAIYNKAARFIQRSGEVDTMLTVIGWGMLWMQENRTYSGLMFRSFHPNAVLFDENEEGTIDCAAVEESLNARQLDGVYKRYGLPTPKHVDDALKDPRNASAFHIAQIVLPRDDRDGQRIQAPQGMPFTSALIDFKGENVITEMGFHEFPAAIPRWDTTPGEIYPRSPGMMALPDSRTLQAMGKTLLIGGQRAVDPPIWVQNDAILSPLRSFPGGITVIDPSDTQGNMPIGSFPVSENIPLGREMQNDYRTKVEAAFFKNIFNLPLNAPNMTATEVLERKDEFIRVIGPVFGRLETDYAGHVVERVFAIMERAGAFPPRPQGLQNVKITFTFQSPIQQARKQLEIAGFAKALELLNPLIAFKPHILDHFDEDAIARDAPEWSGMTPRWIRAQKEVDAIRQKTEQAAQGNTMAAQAPDVTGALRNVAEANLASARGDKIAGTIPSVVPGGPPGLPIGLQAGLPPA